MQISHPPPYELDVFSEKEVTISDGKLIGKSWRRKQISLESGLKRWSFKAESADNNIWIDEIKLEKSACKYVSSSF